MRSVHDHRARRAGGATRIAASVLAAGALVALAACAGGTSAPGPASPRIVAATAPPTATIPTTPSTARTPDPTPATRSVAERLAARSFPSIHQAWNQADNLATEGPERTAARHDLLWQWPEFYGLRWDSPFRVLGTDFSADSVAAARARRSRLLALNPNMILLGEITYRDMRTEGLPSDHPWWQRDANGKRILGFAEGDHYLTDWHNAAFRQAMAAQAKALLATGVVDGVMLDWWDDRDPDRLSMVRQVREAVGPDALIIVNPNWNRTPNAALYINGLFMETAIPCGRCFTPPNEAAEWKRASETLLWAEANLRPPRLNAFETWACDPHPGSAVPCGANGRSTLSRMRATTTLALTHANGTVLFGDHNDLPTPDHLHDWYPFWEKSLGRATGERIARPDGASQREFEMGTVVYNPIGNAGIQVRFAEPRRSAATGRVDQSFTLSPFDGDLYLKTR